MAELEMMTEGSLAGPVRELGRWGLLRHLPRWLGEQVAAGARVGTWDPPAPLTPPRREQPLGAGPAQTAAPRATAVALERTISAWRAAERDLNALQVGSSDHAQLRTEIDALRATHHRLFFELTGRR